MQCFRVKVSELRGFNTKAYQSVRHVNVFIRHAKFYKIMSILFKLAAEISYRTTGLARERKF